jgi:hypothetical protein
LPVQEESNKVTDTAAPAIRFKKDLFINSILFLLSI